MKAVPVSSISKSGTVPLLIKLAIFHSPGSSDAIWCNNLEMNSSEDQIVEKLRNRPKGAVLSQRVICGLMVVEDSPKESSGLKPLRL